MSNLKEAAKMVFWVKGHIWQSLFRMSEEERESVINGYTRRLWHNEEAGQWFDEDKFEEAYKAAEKKYYGCEFWKDRQ